MDKWRFAHFEEEKGGERVARKGCFLGWFIFNSVARRRSSFSALPVQPSLLTAFRKYVAFLLFLRRDARRNFATETKLHVTLFFGSYSSTFVNSRTRSEKFHFHGNWFVRESKELFARRGSRGIISVNRIRFDRSFVFVASFLPRDLFPFEDKKSDFILIE